MSGIFWVLLVFLLVAATKYATSVRLRHLRERMERDKQTADDLSRVLEMAAEREDELKSETAGLQTKLTTLRNIVANLERAILRAGR